MTKLSKHNKRVLGIVVLFIAVFVVGVSIITVTGKKERKKITDPAVIASIKGDEPPSESYVAKKKLSEFKRKTIFNALVKLQDTYSTLYPYDQDKQQYAYKEIAKRYYIIETTVRNIAIEGAKKGWVYDIDK